MHEMHKNARAYGRLLQRRKCNGHHFSGYEIGDKYGAKNTKGAITETTVSRNRAPNATRDGAALFAAGWADTLP
jgi:hypothetical protein